MQPYRDCPSLLPFLLQLLQSHSGYQDVTRAALRCIGVLGALDPQQYMNLVSERQRGVPPLGLLFRPADAGRYRIGDAEQKQNLLLREGRLHRPLLARMFRWDALGKPNHSARQEMSQTALSCEAEQRPEVCGPSCSERSSSTGSEMSSSGQSDDTNDKKQVAKTRVDRFSRQVVVALLRLLTDPSQTPLVRQTTMQTLLRVLRRIDAGAAIFAPVVLPVLLNTAMKSWVPTDRTELLNYIAHMISICHRAARPHQSQLYSIIDSILTQLIVLQKKIESGASNDTTLGHTTAPVGPSSYRFARTHSLYFVQYNCLVLEAPRAKASREVRRKFLCLELLR